mmetsp:Transcript_43092/g.69956  ORF Transcript_43092/g.69956 Transcript_43092/m.69956 type:complete len:660 (+) Transcript_43092:125-2104(+)
MGPHAREDAGSPSPPVAAPVRAPGTWRTISPADLQLLGTLGAGSGSTVFKASFENREVAVKKPKITCSGDIRMFGDELALLARFDHPNIVGLIGASTTPPDRMIVLELLSRGTLFDILHTEKKRVQVELPLRISLALDIARAMQYLHSLNFVHGDLKSANVLINSDWVAKLSDLDSTSHESQLLPDVFKNRRPTRPSNGVGFGKPKLVGTPLWMAPEILQKQPRSTKSDVYSFGVLLNEVISATLPYADRKKDPDLNNLLVAIASQDKRPTISPSTPQPLADLITSCWHSDPATRPTFDEISHVLSIVMMEHPVTAYPAERVVEEEEEEVAPEVNQEQQGPQPFRQPVQGLLRTNAADGVAPPPVPVGVVLPVVAEVFAAQGPRRNMEDRHVMMQQVKGRPGEHLFAVFDGHGGHRAAEFAAERLPEELLNSSEYDSDPVSALKKAFLATDVAFLEESRIRGYDDGTTGIVVLIKGDTLYVANAGDCRAVLGRGASAINGKPQAVPLSEDHKAHRADEQEAIRMRGGFVKLYSDENKWRAQGALDTTRCIGDRPYKPFLTAEPDVLVHHVERGLDDFIVIASDGLWDTTTSQLAVDTIASTTRDPYMCAKRLASDTYERNSFDNVTIIVVFLRELNTLEKVFTGNENTAQPVAAADVVA